MSETAADLRAIADGHMRRGESAVALIAYDQLLALSPGDALGHINRGVALNRLGRTPDALAAFERAAALDPQLAIAHSNRAQALNALDRFAEALESAERAVELDAGLPNAWRHLGTAQFHLGRLDDALASFRQGARLAGPAQRVEAFSDMAMILAEQGRYDQAIEAYGQAEALDPAASGVRYRRSHARLLQGDFAAGWADYEARWQGRFADDRAIGHVTPELRRRFALFPTPDMLRGKRVLAVAEQGIGDEIMFASVLPDLTAIAAHVTCIVDPRLQTLLAFAMPGVEIVAGVGPGLVNPDRFDLVLALGSLPHAFRRAAEDFPGEAYLRPPPGATEAWRERLGPAEGRTRVGLCWRGGVARTRAGARSLDLETLRRVLERPDCDFISLQHGDVADELAAFNATLPRPIRAFPSHELHAFAELAGLTRALDAVVTVQTALAHLAGALGQTGLVMVPPRPEWCFAGTGPDCPWYRSLRILRRADDQNWAPVVAAVDREISARRNGRP